MLTLQECKVGSKVNIYIDNIGYISDALTINTVRATILCIVPSKSTKDDVLLGWVLNEPQPKDAWAIVSNPFGIQGYEKYAQGYVFCTWVKGHLPVHSISFAGVQPKEVVKTGYNCCKCNARNEWAEANRPGNLYLCFECR